MGVGLRRRRADSASLAGRDLPQPLNWINVKHRIAADDGDTFGHRLRDQQAVERVFMVKGERDHLSNVSNRHVKKQKIVARNLNGIIVA